MGILLKSCLKLLIFTFLSNLRLLYQTPVPCSWLITGTHKGLRLLVLFCRFSISPVNACLDTVSLAILCALPQLLLSHSSKSSLAFPFSAISILATHCRILPSSSTCQRAPFLKDTIVGAYLHHWCVKALFFQGQYEHAFIQFSGRGSVIFLKDFLRGGSVPSSYDTLW